MEKTQPLSDHPLAIDAVIAISHTLLKSISNNSFFIDAQFEHIFVSNLIQLEEKVKRTFGLKSNFFNQIKFFVTNWDSIVDLVFETDFNLLQMYFASKGN